jgi:hypothetical protein
LVAAVLTNMGSLWLMKRESTVLASAMRMALLVIGCLGIGNGSEWRTVKQGSKLIQLLEKRARWVR